MLNKAPRFHHQQGQSLILVTMFLGVISLVVLFVFNAGVLSKQKTKLQNVADAAAYSSAVMIARDLNFKAYTNRAMVANQVAIGQYVGLSSWMEMMTISADNLATVTAWIPYVNAVTRTIRQVMSQVNNVAQRGLKIATQVTNFVIGALSNVQKAFHYAMYTASIETATEVINKNDDKITFGAVSLGILANDNRETWFSFNRQMNTSSNARVDKQRDEEFHKIVNNSRDPFSKRRSYTWFSTPRIPFIPAFEIKKAGGSDLKDVRRDEDWTAMDTVAIWQGNFRCKWFKCRWKWKEWLPAGWASSRAGDNYNMRRRDSSAWGQTWRTNPKTSRYASYNTKDGGNYNGLRNFYDIARNGILEKTPDLRVVLSKAQNNVRTSSNAAFEVKDGELSHWGAGQLDIEKDSRFAGNNMSSLSKAEAYFHRPTDLGAMTRGDRKHEFANLYSPYWYPRLIETNRRDRWLASLLINRVAL